MGLLSFGFIGGWDMWGDMYIRDRKATGGITEMTNDKTGTRAGARAMLQGMLWGMAIGSRRGYLRIGASQ